MSKLLDVDNLKVPELVIFSVMIKCNDATCNRVACNE